MHVAADSLSVSEWLSDSSITEATRDNRKRMVQKLERTNHAKIEQILDDIQADKLTVYSVCKRFIDSIRPNLATTTVYGQRSMLPDLWESVLGESNFSRRIFDRLVPIGNVYNSRIKLIPNREQIVTVLKITSPLYRALVCMLAVSGMRIGEALSRKWSDLEIRPEEHAKITLRASETKARYLRYTFLTHECLEWLQAIRTGSDYIFPGANNGHLWYASAQFAIKEAFKKVGLFDTGDSAYTIHSLRTFADAQLRECGLDSKYCSLIVGHRNRLQSEVAYVSWESVEKGWIEKCADKMCFLDTGAVAQKRVVELTRQNGRLELLLEKLLERLDS